MPTDVSQLSLSVLVPAYNEEGSLKETVEALSQQKRHFKDMDMVVGARTGEEVHIPLVRRPAKWMITRLAEYLSQRKIPDLNSGLRVFRKDTALRFLTLYPDGFSFTTTITLAMLTNHYTVKFVP